MNDHLVDQPSKDMQKWVKYFTHFLFVCIIFILPEVLMMQSAPVRPVSWSVYARSALFVAVFYLNYYFILEHCLGRSRWLLRLVGWNCLILFALLFVSQYLWHGMPESRHGDTAYSHMMRQLSFMMRDAVMVALTVALSVAMRFSDGWQRIRHKQQVLENMRQEQELKSLKNQLNPHFLFNTLNGIYALIAISPERAQDAVHKLSHLLRYVLYENSDTVLLKDELSFIENYVRLIKIRLPEGFPVRLDLDYDHCGDMRVAPLLFISPVENAFKYCHTGKGSDFVDIAVTCADGVVRCRIMNSKGCVDGGTPEIRKEQSGIGNVNLQRRLQLIYGNRATLESSSDDNVYKVELIIKLNDNHE